MGGALDTGVWPPRCAALITIAPAGDPANLLKGVILVKFTGFWGVQRNYRKPTRCFALSGSNVKIETRVDRTARGGRSRIVLNR